MAKRSLLGAPLPVELVGFAAVCQGETTRLARAIASEQHSAFFEVERSLNGIRFARIGMVAAQRRSTLQHGANLTRYAAPQVYYRLH